MKPSITGLKDSDGWFYVAECPKCDWSFNWDGQMPWTFVFTAAEWHYWMYAETRSCRSG